VIWCECESFFGAEGKGGHFVVGGNGCGHRGIRLGCVYGMIYGRQCGASAVFCKELLCTGA
jgi:hypothetical protein